MLPLALIACRPPAAPVPDPPAFHFAVVGDRTGEPDDRAWQAVLAEVEGLHPDLVLTVGDLADDALDDSDWALALAPTRAMTSPIAFTPGNHDIVDAATAEAFAVRTGQAPYRSFDFRGVHFVIVDNAVGERWEDLAQAQRDWLAADLLAHTEQMQVVLMHKPFWALRAARGEPDPMHDLFVQAGVRAVFTGHWHAHAHQRIDDVEYVLVGTSGGGSAGVQDPRRGNAYEYVWATVRGEQLDLRTIALGAVQPVDRVSLRDNQVLRALVRGGAVATVSADGAALDVRIRNGTGARIDGDLRILGGDVWRAEPERVAVALAPEEVGEFHVSLSRAPGADWRPLPRFELPVVLPDAGVVPYVGVADVAREVTVGRGAAPTLDGAVGADEWAGATEIDTFTTARGERPEGDATRVWLRWDDEALYVAAKLDDAHPESLSRVHHERDRHVEYDDRIGLLLAPAPDQVYWFYVNPNGAVWDLHADRAAGAVHREWDAVQAAATVGDAGWAVEARIPFEALGGAPAPDAAWRFDVRRKQEAVQAESVFTPTFSLTDPARMGTMRFGALVHAEGREPAAR